jgi:CRP-like cAMP-binding protein
LDSSGETQAGIIDRVGTGTLWLSSTIIMKRIIFRKNRTTNSFNAQAFLDTAGVARTIVEYRRNESIYSQGDAAETVMYV